MNKIRTILAITGAAIAVAGAIACGGGAPHPAPTTSVPTTAAPTTRPTVTPPTTKPPTLQPTAPDPATSAPVSAEQRNAIGTAHDYLEGDQHFSRSGLIDQLKYEGYSTKVATAAVDGLHVNWNEQAAGTARDYLEHQHFSRSGLISQLKYEGYTSSQAAYGVKAAGL